MPSGTSGRMVEPLPRRYRQLVMTAHRPHVNVALAVLLCIAVLGCSVEKENSRSERLVESGSSSENVLLTSDTLSGAVWRPLPQYLPETRIEPRPSKGSIQFAPDGTWTGSDGCNREGGTYSLSSATMTMDHVGLMTQIGCDNFSPQGQLDGTVLMLDASGTHLTALDSDGKVVVEYTR